MLSRFGIKISHKPFIVNHKTNHSFLRIINPKCKFGDIVKPFKFNNIKRQFPNIHYKKSSIMNVGKRHFSDNRDKSDKRELYTECFIIGGWSLCMMVTNKFGYAILIAAQLYTSKNRDILVQFMTVVLCICILIESIFTLIKSYLMFLA